MKTVRFKFVLPYGETIPTPTHKYLAPLCSKQTNLKSFHCHFFFFATNFWLFIIKSNNVNANFFFIHKEE